MGVHDCTCLCVCVSVFMCVFIWVLYVYARSMYICVSMRGCSWEFVGVYTSCVYMAVCSCAGRVAMLAHASRWTHVCARVYICVLMCNCALVFVFTYTHTHTLTHTHAQTHTHTHTHTYTHMH